MSSLDGRTFEVDVLGQLKETFGFEVIIGYIKKPVVGVVIESCLVPVNDDVEFIKGPATKVNLSVLCGCVGDQSWCFLAFGECENDFSSCIVVAKGRDNA